MFRRLLANVPRTPLISVIAVCGAGASAYFILEVPTFQKDFLSPTHFTTATITSNESCGPNFKLLELTVPPHLLHKRDSSSSPFGPIWSVFIKDDDIQVERPYTPLQGVTEDGRMLFWIKKYQKGEVGRWLHAKNVGEQIELRGPIPTWPWKENHWDEIIMISGGTGITPFYQLFDNLISHYSPNINTRFTLLHSSSTPADLPPPNILKPLVAYAAEKPERFAFHVFVDSLDGTPASLPLPALQVGRIGKAAIQRSLGIKYSNDTLWTKLFPKRKIEDEVPRRVLFLVCGPEPMIRAISGPYGRNLSQGRVGGVLAEMGYTSNQVWKL